MKSLLFILLALPYLATSQETTLGGMISNAGPFTGEYRSAFTVNPIDHPFCDTVQQIVLFVCDTVTGNSKTRRVYCERRGNLEQCQAECDWPGCMAYHIKTCKDVKSSRYWYFINGSQVFIDPRRVLQTYPEK